MTLSAPVKSCNDGHLPTVEGTIIENISGLQVGIEPMTSESLTKNSW